MPPKRRRIPSIHLPSQTIANSATSANKVRKAIVPVTAPTATPWQTCPYEHTSYQSLANGEGLWPTKTRGNGELKKLNGLGASDRRLFVKQLENHSVHQPKWISVMTSVATFKSGFHMHPCLASLLIYTSQLTATAALVHPQSRPLIPPTEVRRGFEFSNDRPAFYPPPANASWRVPHFRYKSVFSIASTSSYGHVINSGSNDPFDYGLPSLCERPSSSDMSSISMSMTVDDTFAFIHDQPRHRVDSDASSFYFRPSATAPGTRGRCRRESNMSLSS